VHAADALPDDPLDAARAWLADARAAGVPLPERAVVATATRNGEPSARVVLVRRIDSGFVFHTNYESRKGRNLAENPRAALVAWWQPLGRQLRAEGDVERISPEETAAYFATRPRGSQLGAWASPQSEEIGSPDELEARVADFDRRFAGQEITPPPFWGGYRLVPDRVELWIHGDDRLHDRFAYERAAEGWRIVRLAP